MTKLGTPRNAFYSLVLSAGLVVTVLAEAAAQGLGAGAMQQASDGTAVGGVLTAFGGIAIIVLGVVVIVLAILAILMPLFVYEIKNSAKEATEELRLLRRGMNEVVASIEILSRQFKPNVQSSLVTGTSVRPTGPTAAAPPIRSS